MSQSAMQEITCPKCGKKTSFLVWDSINTMKDPEMKENCYDLCRYVFKGKGTVYGV